MRISFRAALVTAAAALGLISASVAPAHAAATGYARCPSGRFCVFDGQDGQGAMASYTTPQADLGTWRTKASSVYNHTGYQYFCMYSRTDYQYVDAVHDVEVLDAGTNVGDDLYYYHDQNSHLDNNLGSVRWAHTIRQCQGGPEYMPWDNGEAGTPGTPASFGDLNRDGLPDLLNRTYGGRLYFLRGDGTGTLIGAGWNSMTALTRHGDLNGDGAEDLLARDTAGTLWMYPGNGKGWFGARRLIGGGWNVMRTFAGIGDLSGDGRSDLVVSDSSGKLWLYPGNGKGWFGTRKMIGTAGWGPFTTLIGVGNLGGDGHPDLLAAKSPAMGGEVDLYDGRSGTAIGYLGVNSQIDAGDALR
jgi:Peptidase inhibitor family I36/FG-GAP-like repeat